MIATTRGAASSPRFFLPEAGLLPSGSLELRARVDGFDLPPHHYVNPGEYLYEEKFPPAGEAGDLTVEFEVGSVFKIGGDERDLGVLVPFHDGFPLRLI